MQLTSTSEVTWEIYTCDKKTFIEFFNQYLHVNLSKLLAIKLFLWEEFWFFIRESAIRGIKSVTGHLKQTCQVQVLNYWFWNMLRQSDFALQKFANTKSTPRTFSSKELRQCRGRRHLKNVFIFYVKFCGWLGVFTVSYDASLKLQHNVCEPLWVPNGNLF